MQPAFILQITISAVFILCGGRTPFIEMSGYSNPAQSSCFFNGISIESEE
jgi:hypothetical protein